MAETKKYFNTFNFGVVVAYPSGQRPHFLAGGTVGVQVQTPGWLLPFFFLSAYFYPLAFSLLTMLASREFCENVFLV